MKTLRSTASTLLIVDIQQRLSPAIDGAQALTEVTQALLAGARRLSVPVVATEQYPKGLGVTVDALRAHLGDDDILEKITFSAWGDPLFRQRMASLGRQQVVLCGTESHVCVLQTALDLQANGYQVYLVADGVGSRTAESKALALQRMAAAGVIVVNKEMVLFEWLGRAGSDDFRYISTTLIR